MVQIEYISHKYPCAIPIEGSTMPRISPIGIDGVSISWKCNDAGIVDRAVVRVRDAGGTYQAKTFAVVSRAKDGTPRLPIEARQWAEELRGTFIAGVRTAGRALLSEAAASYVADARSRNLSPSYCTDIEKTMFDAESAPGMADIQGEGFAEAARRWLVNGSTRTLKRGPDGAMVRSGQPLSAFTKNKQLQYLRSVVKHAIALGWVARDPLKIVRRFKIPIAGKSVFTLDELVLTASDKARHHPYWPLWWLLIHGGFRVQEAQHLRWQDIDWAGRRIGVRVQTGVYNLKRDRERDVPMQKALADALAPIAKPAGFIIEDDMRRADNKRHQKKFDGFLTSCGIDVRDRTPHSTRHTWASVCIATGAPTALVKKWAGHSDLTTTEGYVGSADSYDRPVRLLDWERGEFDLTGAAGRLQTLGEPIPKAAM